MMAGKKRRGMIKEFLLFVKEKKSYWMIPLVIVLAILLGLIVLGGTSAAPFIYTLF